MDQSRSPPRAPYEHISETIRRHACRALIVWMRGKWCKLVHHHVGHFYANITIRISNSRSFQTWSCYLRYNFFLSLCTVLNRTLPDSRILKLALDVDEKSASSTLDDRAYFSYIFAKLRHLWKELTFIGPYGSDEIPEKNWRSFCAACAILKDDMVANVEGRYVNPFPFPPETYTPFLYGNRLQLGSSPIRAQAECPVVRIQLDSSMDQEIGPAKMNRPHDSEHLSISVRDELSEAGTERNPTSSSVSNGENMTNAGNRGIGHHLAPSRRIRKPKRICTLPGPNAKRACLRRCYRAQIRRRPTKFGRLDWALHARDVVYHKYFALGNGDDFMREISNQLRECLPKNVSDKTIVHGPQEELGPSDRSVKLEDLGSAPVHHESEWCSRQCKHALGDFPITRRANKRCYSVRRAWY